MKYIKKNTWNTWSLIFIFFIFFIIVAILYYVYNKREGYKNNDGINYLDGIDVVYWINLNRSTKRKSSMEKLLNDNEFAGIPNERINAFDGKLEPETVFDKLIIMNKTQSDTEYACLLSHLDTIRKINDSKYEVALILEDDATLEYKKYWKKTVREIMANAPPDWEIIMLNYIYSENQNVLFYNWENTTDEYEKNTDQKYYGGLSYIINKRGATKLMQFYQKEKYVLNPNLIAVSDVYIYQTLNTYVYKYPMFIYQTKNDSTIHENHVPWHVITKQRIQENYNNYNNLST
jgi:GR25 family glycosyltransferase involved in LPS biosynthesis